MVGWTRFCAEFAGRFHGGIRWAKPCVQEQIDDIMEKRRNFCELWVVYAPTRRLGRKVSFASDNKEACLLSLPVVRTQLALQRRDRFNTLGEATTHDTTYTGVEPLAWGAAPKMHAGDKQAILDPAAARDAPLPNSKVNDSTMGLPLFWQEREPKTLRAQLLKDLRGKAVFDATPGSGQLARACLELGVVYTGVAKNQQHLKFLISVLDRYAVALVGRTGSACYDADLAALAKEHFQDVTQMVDQQDLTADSECRDAEEDVEVAC